MTIMTENLNKIFDITDEQPVDIPVPVEFSDDDDIEDSMLTHDYEVARGNLHQLLDHGQSLLGAAISSARESESARSFEVASNLIKQLADINLQLIDLTKKKKDIQTPKNSVTNTTVNNNSVFCGSTNDLHKLINDLKAKREGN